MTALRFETEHAPLWDELAALLDRAEGARGAKDWDGARLARLYRMVCEHLALAQARAYPLHLRGRLEQLAHRAHRQIYRHRRLSAAGLGRLVLVDFPQAVRAHGACLLAAALLFALPLLAIGWASWRDPGFALHLLDLDTLRNYQRMYGDEAAAWGREREADTDWAMFGYYVRNNIGVGFQCFASGLFAGLGSAFYLLYNGAHIGAVAGHLASVGRGGNFFPFVVTHGAFELTAIVLAGAAGLRLGLAGLAPGRRTRVQSLKAAAPAAVTVLYGVVGLLLLAAVLEAFWSSARWIAPGVKYAVGGACWILVAAYLGWQGRPARAAPRHDAGRRVGPGADHAG